MATSFLFLGPPINFPITTDPKLQIIRWIIKFETVEMLLAI